MHIYVYGSSLPVVLCDSAGLLEFTLSSFVILSADISRFVFAFLYGSSSPKSKSVLVTLCSILK